MRHVLLLLACCALPALAQTPPPLPEPSPPPLPGVGKPAGLEPFHIAVGGQQVGPLDQAELQRRIAGRELTAATLVWAPSLPGWTPAGQVPALRALLDRAGPPPLPPGAAQPPAEDAERERITAFLLGEWVQEGPVPNVPNLTSRVQIQFLRDGSYRGLQTYITAGFAAPMRQATPIEGTWNVFPLQGQRFAVTLTGSFRHTTEVQILDANTVRDTARENPPLRRTGR